MGFNSIAFFVFLPIVFLLYWLIPHKYRWGLLLVASYYFYMSWNAKYVVLILFTTTVSYITAVILERVDGTKKKAVLSLGIICCLGVLFFFKYFNFFSLNMVELLGAFSIPMNPILIHYALPVGISFYTFQTLSYMIDVYRGTVKAERHFGFYATYISFFPQLVAGPIERIDRLLPQIKSKKEFNYDKALYGLEIMIWGFFKKIVVADSLANYVDAVYGSLRKYTGIDLVIAVIFFTVQIYCDFSGYSDIAIGTAKLLGVDLMENFKSPYFAASLKEFWSEWHISLSTWFRDYVYIPLGGNRCSRLRHNLNLLVTFLISGLWHGANWTYVVWGGIHGLAQVLENIFDKPLKYIRSRAAGKWISILVVFIFCNIAWIFFRADSIADAFYVLQHMLDGVTNTTVYFNNAIGLKGRDLLIILILIVLIFIFDFLSLKKNIIMEGKKYPKFVRAFVNWGLITAICVCAISNVSANQFVYFQF